MSSVASSRRPGQGQHVSAGRCGAPSAAPGGAQHEARASGRQQLPRPADRVRVEAIGQAVQRGRVAASGDDLKSGAGTCTPRCRNAGTRPRRRARRHAGAAAPPCSTISMPRRAARLAQRA
jgi:hypothetical protein